MSNSCPSNGSKTQLRISTLNGYGLAFAGRGGRIAGCGVFLSPDVIMRILSYNGSDMELSSPSADVAKAWFNAFQRCINEVCDMSMSLTMASTMCSHVRPA